MILLNKYVSMYFILSNYVNWIRRYISSAINCAVVFYKNQKCSNNMLQDFNNIDHFEIPNFNKKKVKSLFC